tara:strand:+ start:3681 stop:3878 length:198 start_codon:yes stop_codon:yes gene_type:complete
MANNGGTVIADKTKLIVSSFTGTAAEIQAAFRSAIANNDVIISADVSKRSHNQTLTLTVVWYDVA